MSLGARLFALLKVMEILIIPTTVYSASYILQRDPILLIHGFSSGPETWASFINKVTAEYGWRYGGTLTTRFHIVEESLRVFGHPTQAADIYALRFPDTGTFNKTFFEQAEDLEIAVDYILGVTRKQKVILVGHSMGGLTARAFITSSTANAQKVSQLITIGTPHLGAPAASLINQLACAACQPAQALRDLTPESGALKRLNNSSDWDKPIAYASIVVNNDTAVPVESQNLQNTGARVISHKVININAVEIVTPCLNSHTCETRNREIHNKIIEEILNQPLVINLRRTSTATIWLPSMALQLILETNRNVTGDLYAGVVNSNGRLFFLQSLENSYWSETSRQVLLREIPQGNLYVVNDWLRDLWDWPTGWQNFYAVITRSQADVADTSQWISNLAGPVRLGISHEFF